MTKKRDLLSGIFFLIFSIMVYIFSYSIKVSKAEIAGPQFFPRVVAVVLGILSILFILKSLKLEDTKTTSGKVEKEVMFNKPLVYSMLLLGFYMLTIDLIGFVILSIIYLFLQMQILHSMKLKTPKRIIIESIVAISIPILINSLFYNVFRIFLPSGILG